MNIKVSFAECSKCPLLNCESAIADTNCPDDIRKTQILFVAENPGKDEVAGGVCEGITYPPGTPLIGKAGTIFRKVLNKNVKAEGIKYFITNTVLCCTIKPDGTTGNPEPDVIDRCKINLFKMIAMCNPKLVVVMGTTPMKALGIEGGITKNQGNFFKFNNPECYKDFDVLVAVHPSYVARNGGLDTQTGHEFERCFIKAADFVKQRKSTIMANANVVSQKVDKPYMYRIPDKFYTNEYRLIDIQYINYKKQLVFIFRDSQNKKVYYLPTPSENQYYWYEPTEGHNKLVEKVSDLILKIGPYESRNTDKNCYESDRRIIDKHAVDYYIQSEGEPPLVKRNIVFFDIELYLYKTLAFPSITDAKFPINMISFAVDDGPVQVWLLKIEGEIDNRIDEVAKQFPNLRMFTDEKQMLTQWIKYLQKEDPDFVCGWNSNAFDWQYIFFRMKALKMRTSSISKFDNVWCDGETKAEITGLVCLDLLWLYKNLTYTNEPSYSLENIAQKVLGHGKKEYSGDLSDVYRKDIKTLIEYSFTDTKLIQDLDDAKGHVSLQDELRKAATTTQLGASSTIGLADGLFNYELKKQGLVMINAHHGNEGEDEHIIGAYVRQPVGGIYDWVIDFDYTSLYPSIICSFNIGPNTYIGKISQEEAYHYAYLRDTLFLAKFGEYVIMDPIYNQKATKMTAEEFCDFIKKNNYIVAPSGCIFKNHTEDKSYFYNIIKKLFAQRKTYKKMMFDCKKKQDKFNAKIFDNMQLSYKILMNSLYGVIAQKHFRFYNLDLASTVTISGQELIKFAGDHADKWMHDQTITTINPMFEKTIEEEKDYLKYCDTDSLFIWMKPYLEKNGIEPTVENIKIESAKIQNFLNKVILKAYINKHNISTEESMFDLKNELVCKRYYSLNVKKKYALHVISQEGVDKDEVEVKGLEVRRSDFSESTKEMLNKIINMILRTQEVSIVEIEKYIDEVRTKTLNLIAKGDPSIFKTVAYTKPLEEYKTIPQAIRGMQIWNILEYDHFRVGMRGILVPIRGLDMFNAPDHVKEAFGDKLVKQFNIKKDFTVIVVPEELQKIPSYYAIDVDKVLEFSIYDRVNLLLEPLHKSVSSEQLKWDF